MKNIFLYLCITLLCGSNLFAQTGWTRLTPSTNPGSRDSHNMVWDSESKRAILYGSHSSVGNPAYYVETWAYNYGGNTWTKMNPSTNPGARAEYGLVYNSVDDRVILFGGVASYLPGGTPGPGKTNDIWAYDFNTDTWMNLNPSLKPDTIGVCRIAYDSESDKIIHFDLSTAKTWAYDYTTNTWQNMNPPNPKPAADWRALTAFTYDSRHDRVLALLPSPQYLWAYDYNSNRWEQRSSSPNDPLSGGGLYDMDYDSVNDKVMLYGDDQKTWIYDWTIDRWTDMTTNPTPHAHHHAIAFMTQPGKFLLYGGEVGSNNQTWT